MPLMDTEEKGAACVRPYRSADRDALRRIAADTAFFGQPLEVYMTDRDLFNDAFYVYYTDYEPGHVWIATVGEEVVGFLTGCTDTRRRNRVDREQIRPQLIRNILRGRYTIDRRTLRYVYHVYRAEREGSFTAVDLDRYPAHLHINLLPASRGRGLGKALMQTYLDYLRDAGVWGVHLQTTSRNRAAIGLYERFGFRLLEARRSHVFDYLLDESLYNLAYGLRLC